jgi:hypothetical protein
LALFIISNFPFQLSYFGITGQKPTPHGADNLLQTKPLYLLAEITVNIKNVKYVLLTRDQTTALFTTDFTDGIPHNMSALYKLLLTKQGCIFQSNLPVNGQSLTWL